MKGNGMLRSKALKCHTPAAGASENCLTPSGGGMTLHSKNRSEETVLHQQSLPLSNMCFIVCMFVFEWQRPRML